MEDDDVAEVVGRVAARFRFFDLPFELRLRVFEFALLVPKTIDLDPTNLRALGPHLRLFFVSHRMHEEAYRVFYGRNTFRVFPIHGRFFHTKAPLLARLSPRYRATITKLELRLGPGWTKPPRCWAVDGRLGLADLGKMRTLKIFVECDPSSHPAFDGYGNGENWYTEFSVALARSLITQAPSVAEVEFDGYPGVPPSAPLVQGLLKEVKTHNKRITGSKERGWDKIVEVDVVPVVALESMMRKLGLDRRYE